MPESYWASPSSIWGTSTAPNSPYPLLAPAETLSPISIVPIEPLPLVGRVDFYCYELESDVLDPDLEPYKTTREFLKQDDERYGQAFMTQQEEDDFVARFFN